MIKPFIKDDIAHKENLSIAYMQIIYRQEPDCTEDRDDNDQELIIETRNGGGGHFFNIKTGESGWSLDSDDIENNLSEIVKDFKTRLDYNSVEPNYLKSCN